MDMYRNTDFLAKALNASSLRNEVISANIANVDTPGYKRKDVNFQSYLENALRDNDKSDMDLSRRGSLSVFEDNSNLSYRSDNNNVNIDKEMALLAQNQLQYNTLISQVNYNFSRLKMVLSK